MLLELFHGPSSLCELPTEGLIGFGGRGGSSCILLSFSFVGHLGLSFCSDLLCSFSCWVFRGSLFVVDGLYLVVMSFDLLNAVLIIMKVEMYINIGPASQQTYRALVIINPTATASSTTTILPNLKTKIVITQSIFKLGP